MPRTTTIRGVPCVSLGGTPGRFDGDVFVVVPDRAVRRIAAKRREDVTAGDRNLLDLLIQHHPRRDPDTGEISCRYCAAGWGHPHRDDCPYVKAKSLLAELDSLGRWRPASWTSGTPEKGSAPQNNLYP